MQAPTIDYVRTVLRQLAPTDEFEEQVLRDESGEVARTIRSGEVIAVWDARSKKVRIYGADGRHLAGHS